ncbi:MAG: ABC transporter ATP-binding protein [Bosea sp. (in: a-proteobacteria)]|uniref:ABC transporter ATP-binding protein n=1 Tax=Bosea sp. (in: a-proteobacteria) TaxID=1871050 RepID=UPI003F7BC184
MPALPSPEQPSGRLTLEGLALDHRDADGKPFRLFELPLLTIEPGSCIGISGPSGCGKSSLLHLIAGLLRPSQGRVLWSDRAVSDLSESDRDRWRRETIGFVFQDFHLIPELDIAANIALPARFSAWNLRADEKDRAAALARRMGLPDPRRRAALLSRGEQQRVAIARALFTRPALILADEPTASLGTGHAAEVADLLLETAMESGATLICATHDPALLARFGQRLDLSHAPQRRAA